MIDERRRQIEEIVTVVLGLPTKERAAHLDSVCADDSELRRNVESLLAQEPRAHAFLETPALEAAARALAREQSGALQGRTAGPYRIEALLGAGGMGEVYRGLDTRLRRAVALKFLSKHFLTDPTAVDRFEREARAASALSHPNICVVHDVGELDGRPFIAMEYLEGQTLRARLGGGPLPRTEALQYAAQIAHGLAAAHQKGVVHRDLKPENLWITSDGRIKILDFGLAKVSERFDEPETATVSLATEPGRVMGTVGYMSPEQVRGRPVDHRTDLFAFGAILHEMMSGRRTFAGPSAADTLSAILNQEPPELADSGVNRLVRHCLEKEVARRIPSASDLVTALDELLNTRPVPTDAPPMTTGLAPSSSRPRRWLLRTGAGTMALALLFGIWSVLPQRSRSLLPFGRPHIKRLAVLPFSNLSGDAEQEYFADGMTDVLIADLAQIGALRVISRTSIMQFKGTKKPLPEIAKQLGVDDVVTATVMKSGDRARITAELVDGSTDEHLWSKVYERELSDVLTLQGEVARTIADEVQARVTPQEAGRLSRSRAVAPATLEAYLKGRYYWRQYKAEPMLKAIEYFDEAIRLDPNYAAAYAGFGDSWEALYRIGTASYEEAIPKAREAVQKALALDDTLSEAHTAMAALHLQDWDWKGAEDEDQKAIRLDPASSEAHLYYSTFLRYMGRFDESIGEAKRALEMDPLALLTNQGVGNAYLSSRQYDLAITQYQKALELYPNDSDLMFLLGWAYAYKRNYDKAIELIEKSQVADGDDPRLSPDLAYIRAVMGKKEEARQTLSLVLELARKMPLQPGMIALIYLGLDDRQQTLDWLEKAVEQRSPMVLWLKTDPRFDKIRGEPRFQALMRQVAFP
jgi:serine/threonine-protein kinase